MRFVVGAAIFALAACQPAPMEEAKSPTPEEMGQDDPAAPFTPAPVPGARTYEAMSKTAMSFTPGVLTLTPTPQESANLPPGAVFAFGNGIIYKTAEMPGGAEMLTMGEPVDWKSLFIDTTGAPIDVAKIRMYSIETETVPPGTPNGGLCKKASFLATYTVISSGAEGITIAAFEGDQWPPKTATALCGTFTYASVH